MLDEHASALFPLRDQPEVGEESSVAGGANMIEKRLRLEIAGSGGDLKRAVASWRVENHRVEEFAVDVDGSLEGKTAAGHEIHDRFVDMHVLPDVVLRSRLYRGRAQQQGQQEPPDKPAIHASRRRLKPPTRRSPR